MSAPGHVDFYAIVLFLHIVAALAAFGVTFAYPIIDAAVRRIDLRSVPTYHEVQIQIGRRLVTPAAVVVLAAGLYLALDRWKDAGSGWFTGAGIIIIVILGIEHAVLIPNARQLRDRAALDLQDSAGGTLALSADYERLARQRMIFGGVDQLLVVIAVFLMVVKPGA
jgi:uncharacterized membrane protein